MIKLWPIANTIFDNMAVISNFITEIKLRACKGHDPKSCRSQESACKNGIVESPLENLKGRKSKQNLYTSSDQQPIHNYLILVVG